MKEQAHTLGDIPRDSEGRAHVVALSGGKDSTALALALAEYEPANPYTYVCTPTGDELPEMFAHWRSLSRRLGKTIIPIMGGTLRSTCEEEGALPNWRMRFCTRRLKIAPFRAWVLERAPCVVYVGLRADEAERAGTDYGGDIDLATGLVAVEQRYPLREWGWTLGEVLRYLDAREVSIPERTDCARCFFQTLGEWWKLWRDHPEVYADAEAQEQEFGHTFRSAGRDSWPAGLRELRGRFERGEVPRKANQVDLFRQQTCRACTL